MLKRYDATIGIAWEWVEKPSIQTAFIVKFSVSRISYRFAKAVWIKATSRCAADGCIVKAPLGKRGIQGESEATGSNPTDRGKSGSKRHLLTDQKGIPLSVVLSGANRHDMKKLDDLLEATLLYPPLEVRQNLCLDRGYDYAECRMLAEDFGYTPHIPDTNKPVPAPGDPNRHPPKRWIVEVSHSRFNRRSTCIN